MTVPAGVRERGRFTGLARSGGGRKVSLLCGNFTVRANTSNVGRRADATAIVSP